MAKSGISCLDKCFKPTEAKISKLEKNKQFKMTDFNQKAVKRNLNVFSFSEKFRTEYTSQKKSAGVQQNLIRSSLIP